MRVPFSANNPIDYKLPGNDKSPSKCTCIEMKLIYYMTFWSVTKTNKCKLKTYNFDQHCFSSVSKRFFYSCYKPLGNKAPSLQELLKPIRSRKAKRQTFHERNNTWCVKLVKSSTSGSVRLVWMSLDRPKRSFCLLQTDRKSEDGFRDKRRS